MVSFIGRRDPEFDKVRELRSKLRQNTIELGRLIYLKNTVDKTDPRYNQIRNKLWNAEYLEDVLKRSITCEEKRLKESGIFIDALRRQ